MTDTFAESADETVLSNIAQSLKFLAKGEHVRSKDVHLQLQRLVSRLAARFVELLDQRASIGDEADIKKANKRNAPKKINSRPSKKSRGQSSQSSRSSQSGVDSDDEGGGHDMGEHGESKDIEYSIFLSLKRLRILAKRMNLSELLNDDSAIETLCSKVAEHTASRLKDRQVISSEEDDNEPTFTVPDIWKNGGKGIHSVVGLEVAEALDFLLVVTLWSRKTVADQDNDVSDDDLVDFHVVKKRDQIVNLVSLCFEQYLPLNDGEELTQKYTEEHIAFSHAVQATASQVMSDLRALFPREWADAASPSLRAMALTEDQQLAAGFVRFFRSVEDKLRLAESEAVSENVDLVREMFLPFARSLATNWKYGNRREAGYALAHITGSGPEAAKIVGAMARVVKKIDPVRLLETQMACLRTSFEDWLNSEPEEPESDRPTDDEMANYDEAQIKYQEKFQLMEQQASRLSQSLGVGKLSDPKLKKPLLGFVREGVRFSFSTDVPGEEPLMPGGRLIFLSLLTKYASWIRRNKDQRSTLLEDLDERENELRVDPEFVDVRQDDLQALEQFRKALGYAVFDAKATSPRSTATSHHSMDGEESGDEGGVDSGSAGPSSSSSKVRGRLSRASSIGSARSSRLSTTQSSLSPLPEEDGPRSSPDDDEDLSPSPGKFRKVAGSQRSGRSSIRSNLSVSSIGRSGTIEEGSGEDSDMSDTQLSS
jgi:cohesin complex subunit SA-1/2